MALAYAVANFAAVDTVSFTWTALTGSLSNPTPNVLSCSTTVTDGSGPVEVNLQGVATNAGGTVVSSAPFTGKVVLLASD